MREIRSMSGKNEIRFFVLILTFIFICTFNQLPAQVSTYYRTYNMGGMQGGLGTLNMPDGGFIGTGQHEANGSAGDCDIYVYRVDACGNILWMKLIGTGGQEGAKSISLRNSGNILLTGLYSSTGLLIEMDPAGNLIWEKRYSGVSWTLASTENSAGEIFATCTYPQSYAVIKTDVAGNVLWTRMVGGLGEMPLSAISHNNEVFITCTAHTPGGDFSVAKLDGQGNLIWSYIYGGAGFGDADHSNWGNKAIYDSTDNTIMVVNQTVINGSEDVLLVKIDGASGNVVWSRTYGGAGSEQPRDITETDVGYAVIGNTSSFPVGVTSTNTESMDERDVLLLNLDSLGNLLWARTYGGAERDKGIGLRYNPGAGFLMSAYTSSPVFGNTDQSMDPLFIKADTAGFVACQTYSPAVPSQPVALNRTQAGYMNPINISSSPSNSIVSDLIPADHYLCLNCFTDPIFVPSDTTVCVNDTVYFYNTTSIGFTCYQEWSINGDLFNGGIDTLAYVFSSPGTYPILLYSNCGGQTDTFIVNITVYPLPEADFSVLSNCIGDPAIFTNTSTISSGTISGYSWDFGDNGTSVNVSPLHTYQTIGQFTVILQAISDQSCRSQTTRLVDVYPNPSGDFTATKACAGGITELEYQAVTGGGAPSQWMWNDGVSGTWLSGTHEFQTSYPSPGSFMATMVIINDIGCDDTISKPVVVYPRPAPAFTAADVCFDTPATLVNQSVVVQGVVPYYIWKWGDGSVSHQVSPSPHLYSDTGAYIVTLIIEDSLLSGCVDSTQLLIRVWPLPVPFFLDIPPACEPYAFRLQDSSYVPNSSIASWIWNLGNGLTSTIRNPDVVYTTDGDFSITLNVTSAEGCVAAAPYSSNVTVYPKPVADFTYSPVEPTIYFPEVYFSERCLGGLDMLWDFGDTATSTENELFHSFESPGRYVVTLITTSDKGCRDTAVREIIVRDDFSFYLPNAFSPNNDGLNEIYRPACYNISGYEMEIFDRWGELVFKTTLQDSGWDGTVQGREAPQGIYVYKVIYSSTTGASGYLTGKLSLVR